jgi:hypothetical protein
MRRLNKNLSWENVVRMAVGDMNGITTTDDDFILVGSKPGWSVGHPRFFSSKPTGGLHQVAMYRQKHIIGAHNHVTGVSKVNNTFITIDPGAMCKPELTAYYMRSNGLSKFQEWSAGFVAVQDDIPQLFTDGLTRWSDYL